MPVESNMNILLAISFSLAIIYWSVFSQTFPFTEMLSYEVQTEAELTSEPISTQANIHGSTPAPWNMARLYRAD